MTASSSISVSNATVQLDGRSVLGGVSVDAASGQLTAIFGHNGAGKSTLMRAILGLVPLSGGRIDLSFGQWQADPGYLLRIGVSYLPQGKNLFEHMLVEENLRVVAEAAGVSAQQFRSTYDALAVHFPLLMQARHVAAGRLSGGEAQQVALARAFVSNASLILLDEPSVGLAAAVRGRAFRAIADLARQRNAAVIVAEHRIQETLAVSEMAYVLRQGRVALRTRAEHLRTDPSHLRFLIA